MRRENESLSSFTNGSHPGKHGQSGTNLHGNQRIEIIPSMLSASKSFMLLSYLKVEKPNTHLVRYRQPMEQKGEDTRVYHKPLKLDGGYKNHVYDIVRARAL